MRDCGTVRGYRNRRYCLYNRAQTVLSCISFSKTLSVILREGGGSIISILERLCVVFYTKIKEWILRLRGE